MTPEQVAQGHLEALADEWAETDSVHFVLDVDGTTYLDVNEQIQFDSAKGDLARPDMAQAEAKIKIGFLDRDVGIIIIGDDAYMTNFLSGDWERAAANFSFNPALLFNDRRGIGPVLEDLDDPAVAGAERVAGVETRRITGTTSESDIDRLVGGSLEGDEILVDVWMDEDTDQIVQLRLSETEGNDPVAWILEFSRHNQPVEIEAPDL